MASGSGSREYETGQWRRAPTRKMTRRSSRVEPLQEEAPDSELVPSSLASIVPILRVANEIEAENPRVAYLCRFHAFEKAHNLDPISSGRGVRQFKTYLLHRLQKEEEETPRRLATNDLREIQLFYKWYHENYIKDGRERTREEMAKHYQIASVLYDVLKTVSRGKVDDEIERQAREVERKKVYFGPYNILPHYFSGPSPAIMELPEIKAAMNELCKVDNLPKPRVQSTPNA